MASLLSLPCPTFLPLWIGLPRRQEQRYRGKGKGIAREWGFSLTRRRCEDGLLLAGVAWGIWKLGHVWHEVAIAGGMSLLCLNTPAWACKLNVRTLVTARSIGCLHGNAASGTQCPCPLSHQRRLCSTELTGLSLVYTCNKRPRQIESPVALDNCAYLDNRRHSRRATSYISQWYDGCRSSH